MPETTNSLGGSIPVSMAVRRCCAVAAWGLACQPFPGWASTASGKGFSAHLTSLLTLFCLWAVDWDWKVLGGGLLHLCDRFWGAEAPELVLLVGPCRAAELPSLAQGLRGTCWALVCTRSGFIAGLLLCLLFSTVITDYLYQAIASACGPVHNMAYLFIGITLFTTAA